MDRTEPSIDRRLQEICSIFIWCIFRGKVCSAASCWRRDNSQIKKAVNHVDHAHVFATDIDATIQWWCGHLGAKVCFDDRLAGSRNVFLAVGTGRLHIYDQAPGDRGRGAVHHLGVKVANLRDVWPRLQAQGITSPHGLREQDGWRYVMISAPDGILVELFEFDDPSAPANADPGAGF